MPIPLKNGSLVSGPITTYTDNDKYATGYANEINGGLHVAATTTERNAIPKDRRLLGMHCQVINATTKAKTEYILINNPTTDTTTDADWTNVVPTASDVLMADATSVESTIAGLKADIKTRRMYYVVGVSDLAVGPCNLELPCSLNMNLEVATLTIPKGTVLTKNLNANVEVYKNNKWNLITTLAIAAGSTDNVTVKVSAYLVAPDDKIRLNFIDVDVEAKNIVAIFDFTEV